MVKISVDRLFTEVAPDAVLSYREAWISYVSALEPVGLLDNKLRLRHFLAQTLHETGGYHILVENLNYSAQGLIKTWPSRFKTLEVAQFYAHKPQAIANKTYGGRMGNVDPDDGWTYIGRGLLQLTGRESYERIGRTLGIDLVGNPNLAYSSEQALRVAAAEWISNGCNVPADRDDVRAVTRAVSGGLIGLASRMSWLERVGSLVEEV